MKKLLLLSFISIFSLNLSANVIYVKQNSEGTGDGSSWQNATDDLSGVIYNAQAYDTIWVAQGVYYPVLNALGDTATSASNAIFTLRSSNVVVLGGFNGTETDRSQRNGKANPTILTGNPQKYGLNAPFSQYRHILRQVDRINNFLTDFIIEETSSLALYVVRNVVSNSIDLQIFNCVFRNNKGSSSTSGASLRVDRARAFVIDSEFHDNEALEAPAIWITNQSIIGVNRCTFKNNTALSHGGAVTAASMMSGQAGFFNCLFENNRALGPSFAGGAIHNFQTSPSFPTLIYNCTFFNNIASVPANDGHSININDGVADIQNCIFWNHEPFTGSHFSTTNSNFWNSMNAKNTIAQNTENLSRRVFDVYPEFADTANKDFTLLPHSPAIDSGDTSGIMHFLGTVDLAGNARVVGIAVDMGAYEFFCPAINKNITLTNNTTLSVPSTQGASYRWYDCTNQTVISGATSPVFNPQASGTYACIIENSCEQRDTTDCIEVCLPLDLTVTESGNTLSVSQTNVDYQWINCDDQSEISGATQSSFTPEVSGTYACILNDGTCSDTTDCVTVEIVGVENLTRNHLKVYPNPVTDQLRIESTDFIENIRITNISGQIVHNQDGNINEISLNHLPSGMYVITITTSNDTFNKPLIKR